MNSRGGEGGEKLFEGAFSTFLRAKTETGVNSRGGGGGGNNYSKAHFLHFFISSFSFIYSYFLFIHS